MEENLARKLALFSKLAKWIACHKRRLPPELFQAKARPRAPAFGHIAETDLLRHRMTYELYLAGGCEPSMNAEDWLVAARLIMRVFAIATEYRLRARCSFARTASWLGGPE